MHKLVSSSLVYIQNISCGFLFFIVKYFKILNNVVNLFLGVKHPNIICDGCSKAGIAGIRFRCAQCTNYDLCASCYGSDLHDLDHSFIRYQTANSVG